MAVEAPMAKQGKNRLLIVGLIVLAIPTVFAVRALVGDPVETRLAGSRPSLDELAVDFLEALHSGDEQRIRQLALSKDEFVQYVWPELPASDPSTNLNSDFIWEQTYIHSLADLSGTLYKHKGRKYELSEVRFEDGTKDYGKYKVHRDARLRVINENGKEGELNLFGSVLEMEGEFKIYSFVR
jgi:hypothetical protein